MQTWFEKLVGFEEENSDQVRANLRLEGEKIISKANGRIFQCGQLEIASLADLSDQAPDLAGFNSQLVLKEVVANVQHLHSEEANRNALFQAASQFNLLEMVGPDVSPERGIGIYEHDPTQGPACAIACGAGTIYRNYLVPVKGKTGQSINNQIDCLDEIGNALNNEELQLWQMRNGYALLTQEGLLQINTHLSQLNKEDRETLKAKLKIGLQWETEVTLNTRQQLVSQAYCSALPVAYSHIDSHYWESFARLILEASYEATFYAALINWQKTGSNKLFLTLVGGGAFGNEENWIMETLLMTLQKFRMLPLNVAIVSYGRSNPAVANLVKDWGK